LPGSMPAGKNWRRSGPRRPGRLESYPGPKPPSSWLLHCRRPLLRTSEDWITRWSSSACIAGCAFRAVRPTTRRSSNAIPLGVASR
jgi:hypothetical protein